MKSELEPRVENEPAPGQPASYNQPLSVSISTNSKSEGIVILFLTMKQMNLFLNKLSFDFIFT